MKIGDQGTAECRTNAETGRQELMYKTEYVKDWRAYSKIAVFNLYLFMHSFFVNLSSLSDEWIGCGV